MAEIHTRRLVLLATLGLLVLVPAPAEAKKREGAITIHARSELQHVQAVDNPPAGGSAGDLFLFTERLLNRRGRPIGDDAAYCVRLFDLTFLCTGTYRLRGGRIMVSLLQPGPGVRYDQAITGGTGRFAGARGTVTVDQRADGDRFTFKIRLRP